MKIKTFLFVSLIAGFTNLLTGGLVYGLILRSYLESHTSALREDPGIGWIVLGHFFIGLCITYVFQLLRIVPSLKRGALIGFTMGFLISLSVNSFILGTSTIFSSPWTALLDVLASGTVWASAGGSVGWLLGRKRKT